MYSIKEAATRSGVSIATLRAWERRYGVVEPARTASGYRLYDDDAINRLRQMRRLLDAGWRPREAAAEVVAGRPHTIESTAPSFGERADKQLPGADGLVEQFVAAVAPFDSAAIEAVLDEAFTRAAFEPAVEHVIFPALREVGRRWALGQVDVAAEHAASETVRRRLAALYNAAARPTAAHDAVVGLPPGARHDLGALAFAAAARRLGVNVLYLGADVPVESWLTALRDTGAAVAVIAVPTQSDAAVAGAVIEAMTERASEVQIMVGGGGSAELRRDHGPNVTRLSDSLAGAATELRERLWRG